MAKHGGARKGAGRRKDKLTPKLKDIFSEAIYNAIQKSFSNEKVAEKPSLLLAKQARLELNDDIGKLYIIQNKQTYNYKVGITTTSLKNRLSHYKTHTDIKVIFCVETPDYFELEQIAHEILADNHVKGEWFDCKIDDIVDLISHITNYLYEN